MAEEIDVIRSQASAPRTRNAAELNAKIAAAGGALIVDANSSDHIVAANNGLRFSITQLPDGRYRITESANWLILAGVAIFAGLFLIRR